MAKEKTVYVCSQCGGDSPKWQGKCPHCEAWNTLQEFREQKSAKRSGYAGEAGAALKMKDVETDAASRFPSGLPELDRVLGGGIVAGGVSLIGGDPGIGKSTLLIQVAAACVAQMPVLYATGEESGSQVSMRAKRLGLDVGEIDLMTETRLDAILSTAQRLRPKLMIVDSIQTINAEYLESAPGSVSQVRECAARLTQYAKASGTSVFLVGHVTKDGTIAGPRVLEHIVDTVLYFEGDPSAGFRLIRAFKNRFGAINELGVFSMTGVGLVEVPNPSALFMASHEVPVAGVCVAAAMEGNRCLLAEMQTLLEDTHMPSARRLAVGVDPNRVNMLLAAMSRHCGLDFMDKNVYASVVGGAAMKEPAADLAVALALASALKGRPLPGKLAAFGEIGLAGELRGVQNAETRIAEAAKLGFDILAMPAANVPSDAPAGVEVIAANRLDKIIQSVFRRT